MVKYSHHNNHHEQINHGKVLVTFKSESSPDSANGELTSDLCFLWLSLCCATYARSGLLRSQVRGWVLREGPRQNANNEMLKLATSLKTASQKDGIEVEVREKRATRCELACLSETSCWKNPISRIPQFRSFAVFRLSQFCEQIFFFSRNVYFFFFFFLKCQLAVLRKKQTQKAAVTRPRPHRLNRLRVIMNESLIYRTFIAAARQRS